MRPAVHREDLGPPIAALRLTPELLPELSRWLETAGIGRDGALLAVASDLQAQ